MKSLDINNLSFGPLLFQLAARLELPALRRILEPVFKAMAIKNSEPRSEGKKSARASDIEGDGNFRNDLPDHDHDEPKHAAHSDNQFRKTLFHLKAPSADSVKLVADFTDWEKYPLDMIRCEEGNWFAIVPLAPGNYSYRFIVDGQWFDDPQLPHRAPNPFGSANATVEIA